MKKLFLSLAVVAMLLPSCKKFEDAINALDNRVTELEGKKIQSIEEQIESINTSISDLGAVGTALKEQIAALEESDEATTEEVAALKAEDAELEQMIGILREYVDSLNQSTKDWVSTTFATLEQFNALSLEVASLKTALENYKVEIANNLANAISTLETSMKSWVNEQLANDYTIAEIDAKISALTQQVAKGDESLQKELNTLKSSLATMKSELTTAYQKAIADAINTNNGIINAKIASEINAVNAKIDNAIATINNRLNDIEDRLDELEGKVDDLMNRKLEITFEETEDIAILAGGSCVVNYTIASSETDVHIATIAQNGWKASVTKSTEKTGYITVYAPNPLTTEPVIVLVSDANTTIMRTLTFVDGVVIITTDNYKLMSEATTLSVDVQSNLEYDINIPLSVQSWISVKEFPTRATLRNETINLIIEENFSTNSRGATLELICNDMKVGALSIHQQGIELANNEIVYTSSNGEIIELYNTGGFGEATIVSNVYSNGKGFIEFSQDITAIGEYAFYNCINLTSILLPKSIEDIRENAFYKTGLAEIDIPENCLSIGNSAFYSTKLKNVTIPSRVSKLGEWAFYDCDSLTSVAIPNKIKSINPYTFANCDNLTNVLVGENVELIGDSAFSSCSSLTNVTIPDSVTSIGEGAFRSSGLATITIPNSVTSIEKNAFSDCGSLIRVVIGNGVTSIGDYAFNRCRKLQDVTIGNNVKTIGEYAFSMCESIRSISIPQSMTMIKLGAFNECNSLISVYCRPISAPRLTSTYGGDYVFHNNGAGRKIYVPKESVEAYQSAWSSYKSAIFGYDFN